ncbi:unnamed protein product, partial [Heterosigma akashiwo]
AERCHERPTAGHLAGLASGTCSDQVFPAPASWRPKIKEQ